ncbi:MAG: amidohydrolase [Vicingaceae bacterium]
MKIIFLFSLIATFCLSCMEKKEVDLIVHNAVIITADETFSTAEAMAVRGDSILEIGPEHLILNKYSSENILDLEKHHVYPGFIDAHSHFWGYAEQLGRIDLLGAKNAGEICERLKAFGGTTKSDWLIGRGWDNTTWSNKEFPTKDCLDEAFPEHYIVLKRIDGHAALVNQKVLDLAGINATTVVEGGKVISVSGNCTGVLIDRAVDLVEELIPPTPEKTMKRLLAKAQSYCFAAGLTSACDAGLDKIQVDLLTQMQSNGNLQIKLYLMLNPTAENFDFYLKNGPIVTRDLSVKSFKFYADGALGSRGAALLKPYTDDNLNYGLILTPQDSLSHYAKILINSDFQMNTHAIGDSANRSVIKIYGEVLRGSNDRRWRIEHAQVVNPSDISLFGQFNIIPSVQPTHCTSDMDWATERLGQDRISHAYAYKDLMEQNGMIAFGTDFPVESINPLYTLLAAKERTDLKGEPVGGYRKEQAIDYENAIRAMTIWAALANGEENGKGSLEKGKKADFVVFNRDLKDLNSSNLESYQLELTFVNGVKVFELEK